MVGTLRRWQPTRPDPDVIAITRDAPGHLWPYYAATGAAIIAHGTVNSGWDGIGQTLRRCGRVGQPGPKDRVVTARMESLATADTLADLHTALVAAARVADRNNRTPNWRQLLDEVTTWADHAHRDAVREKWLRDFYEFQPSQTMHTPD